MDNFTGSSLCIPHCRRHLVRNENLNRHNQGENTVEGLHTRSGYLWYCNYSYKTLGIDIRLCPFAVFLVSTRSLTHHALPTILFHMNPENVALLIPLKVSMWFTCVGSDKDCDKDSDSLKPAEWSRTKWQLLRWQCTSILDPSVSSFHRRS